MNSNNLLFPVLDNRKELKMDIAMHGLRSIMVNEKCSFIATANEGFEYTGNNVMDRALKERFNIIDIPFMRDADEIKVLHKKTGVSKANATVICKIATKIREQAASEEITVAVSTRHTLYASILVEAGMPLAKAMEIAFLPVFRDPNDIAKVKDILTSR